MNCKNGVCVLPQYRIKKTTPCINVRVCYNYCEESELINGFCQECHIFFGKWRNGVEKINVCEDSDKKCSCCKANDKLNVFRPNCEHLLCVDCFRHLYFGYEPSEPVFPNEFQYDIYEENKRTDHFVDWMNDERILNYTKQKLDYQNWIDYKNKNFFFGTKCAECST